MCSEERPQPDDASNAPSLPADTTSESSDEATALTTAPTTEPAAEPIVEIVAAPSDEPPREPWPLTRYLATHNPLYVVSAAFIVYGLFVSFPAEAMPGRVPALALSLAGYVLLLGGTACVLRKLGVLWEDLRMLGLLAVLLLTMVSLALDNPLQADPKTGPLWSLGGALFAAAVAEALVFGLRMRLPLGYRLPYHGLMSLFFLYPIAVQQFAVEAADLRLQWLLFGFATVAAAILLTLVPAILGGPAYVSQNGTPWRFPWYPLAIFAPLVLFVCGRAYFLCESFHVVGEHESIFDPYFLAPLWLALAVLFLAGRRHTRSRLPTNMALMLPAFAAATSFLHSGDDAAQQAFLDQFRAATGMLPPLAVLIAVGAFYGAAAIARVPRAFLGFNAAVVTATFVGRDSTSLFDPPAVMMSWPLLIAGLLLLGRAMLRGEAAKGLAGALSLTAFVVVEGARHPGFPEMILGYHLLIGLFWLLAWRITSEASLSFRVASVAMIVVALVNQYTRGRTGILLEVPDWIVPWYLPCLFLATFSASVLLNDKLLRYTALAILFRMVGVFGIRGYRWAKLYVAGLDALVAGLALFAAAVGISLARRPKPATVPLDDAAPEPQQT